MPEKIEVARGRLFDRKEQRLRMLEGCSKIRELALPYDWGKQNFGVTAIAARDVLAQRQMVDGNGNIQSIAAGPEGEIYFYVQGTKGRKSASCIGRFDQRSGEIRILMDDAKLQSVSGMGISLGLARGKLITS